MAQGYIKAIELPQIIPVFPLPGSILLSRGQLPLNVFEPRYLNMVDDAMAGDRIIGLIQPQTSALEPQPPLARVGCAGRITSFNETSDGRYLITLTGCARFRLASEIPAQTPYRQIRADFASFEADLTAPGIRSNQVYDLDPCFKDLRRSILFVKVRSSPVNRASQFCIDRSFIIDGSTDDVEETS